MRFYLSIAFLLCVVAIAGACAEKRLSGQVIKSADAGNGLTVKIMSADGVLRDGKNELTLVFERADGTGVDVGAASLSFNMPAMGTMPEMNDSATLTTSSKDGSYFADVKLQMAGEWIAQIAYEGKAGKGKVVIPVTAQ